MRWQFVTSILASAALPGADAWREPALRGRNAAASRSHPGVAFNKWTRDGPVAKKFDNANTTQYAIDGTAIPDVDFDIGEAYAGLMPISEDRKGDDKFYFWFQPSPNPAADKEILIWLNGGPGCSSLEGFLQENGPFLWQYGTYKPVANPWAWHHLTNIVWVEQPIGTGFSSGNVTAKNEEDVARQFMGFFKNFVDTFSLQGYKVYITGESYAGMYCPYIANAMLDAKDKTYFNVKGMTIYDPSITPDRMTEMSVVPFVDYHYNLFPLNDTFMKQIHDTDKKCGYADLRDKYLAYPPPGHLPNPLPGTNKSGEGIEGCDDGLLQYTVQDAITEINPCWDVYQVATTCPLLWDVLGFPGSFDYLPKGASIYFDRKDVKKAINAPVDTKWTECSEKRVFVGHDTSPPPASNGVLASVIDRTKNVIIGHGALDFVLIANGTLLGIQNMTWGGKQGFQKCPTEPFYVPYHTKQDKSSIAGAGVFGTAHTERGLTYVGVSLSGHMIPQYAPSAAFRHVEFMLGRVKSLNSKEPFTTDKDVAQSKDPLGKGTAPAGYSKCKTCKRSAPAN